MDAAQPSSPISPARTTANGPIIGCRNRHSSIQSPPVHSGKRIAKRSCANAAAVTAAPLRHAIANAHSGSAKYHQRCSKNVVTYRQPFPSKSPSDHQKPAPGTLAQYVFGTNSRKTANRKTTSATMNPTKIAGASFRRAAGARIHRAPIAIAP